MGRTLDKYRPEYFCFLSQDVSFDFRKENEYIKGFLWYLKDRKFYDEEDRLSVSVSFSEYLEYLRGEGITEDKVSPRLLVSGYLNFLVYLLRVWLPPEVKRDLYSDVGYSIKFVEELIDMSIKQEFGFGFFVDPESLGFELYKYFKYHPIHLFYDGPIVVHFPYGSLDRTLLSMAAVLEYFSSRGELYAGYFPLFSEEKPKEENVLYDDLSLKFVVFFGNVFGFHDHRFVPPDWYYSYLSNVFIVSPSGYKIYREEDKSSWAYFHTLPYRYTSFESGRPSSFKDLSFLEFVGKVMVYAYSKPPYSNSRIFYPVLFTWDCSLWWYRWKFPSPFSVEDCRSLFIRGLDATRVV